MNYKSIQKKAFTLAEMLIVFVIIATLSLLAVKSLNTSYEKKKAVISLQSVYDDLSKAVANGKLENGEVQSWDFAVDISEFVETYLASLKIVKTENWDTVKTKNSLTYKAISGEPEVSFTVFSLPKECTVFSLANGSIIVAPNVYSDEQKNGYIPTERRTLWVDTNGINPPNTIGKDMFPFAISRDGRVLLISWNDVDSLTDACAFKSREDLMKVDTSDNYQCNAEGRGYWCGALIQKDGWKIKDDYPWDAAKSKK